jgi:hypothetical protein
MPGLVLSKHADGGDQLPEAEFRAANANLAELAQDMI